VTKKLKFNVGEDAAEVDSSSDGFYDGPTPPKGIYRTQLKFLRVKDNRNGDPRISGLCEIAEPKGSDKAKYNGYGIWVGLNVTKQGAPYINNFLDTFGFNRKAFWGAGGVTVDENDDPPTILKIGTKTVKEGAACRIRTKFVPAKGGYEEKLEVAGAGFLPLSGDDGGSAWDDEDEEATSSADVEAEDEDAEADEVADDETEEEEAEEAEEEEAEGDEWTLEEISALSRTEIKELLKEWSPDFKVLKRHTDAELAAEVWDKMTGDEAEESDDAEEDEEDPF
jgi:hypothetical protein